MDSTLKVATCQFPVSGSIRRNARRIQAFLGQAKRRRADIVHFSECALSGYAGEDIPSADRIDQPLLRAETTNIMHLARQYRLWIILGSTHPLTPPRKPHNSLYLIDPQGRIADRYDKRFGTPRDLHHYSPGDHFVVFTIKRIRCALLICFDLRFGELYRQLKRQNVQCLFQSFYNARQKGPSIHNVIMCQTMQCRAADNYFWISMANSCARYAPYPSCIIQPDGRIAARLRMHRPGMLVHTVDTAKKF
ncbi:MAG: carbon-nitrogen hydrolase family protein, partial [Sedimentisphaerales bacterium]|nr:carbon-nitrogen hydrolase family protein [Sedimentisphaerales bacterium]